MEPDQLKKASALFAAGDGIARTAALEAAGVSQGIIRARVRAGEWERAAHGVLALGSIPWTWPRRCRLALLAAPEGVALGAASVGRLSGFDGYDADDRIILTYPEPMRPGRLVAGASAIRSRRLSGRDIHAIDGMACVSRPIALTQIAGIDGRNAAAQALDSMLRNGDSPTWIRQVATRLRGPGVSGPPTILRLLDERVEGRLPRSWFQRLAKTALTAKGVPLVDELPVIGADGRLLAQLDLAIPALMIGIECQSWRWHSTPTARANDARRKRQLRALGWEIIDVWWSDLGRIDEVSAELQSVIDQRIPTLWSGNSFP